MNRRRCGAAASPPQAAQGLASVLPLRCPLPRRWYAPAQARCEALLAPAALRLVLLAALASAQLTLYIRAGTGLEALALAACPSWLGGAVLLLPEPGDQPRASVLTRIPRWRFGLGLLALLWCLLHLSGAAQLYDPLLALVPLLALPALALVSIEPLAPRLLLELTLIGALLPLQVLGVRCFPNGWLADACGQVTAALLWLVGQPALAEGPMLLLPDRSVFVAGRCTGLPTMLLCSAAVVMLMILVGPGDQPLWRFGRRSAVVLLLSLVSAFALNAVRIALLSWCAPAGVATGWLFWRSFAFWHDGLGSHLFSLAAMLAATQLFERSLLRPGR